jgi:hypothetical protein
VAGQESHFALFELKTDVGQYFSAIRGQIKKRSSYEKKDEGVRSRSQRPAATAAGAQWQIEHLVEIAVVYMTLPVYADQAAAHYVFRISRILAVPQ